MSPWWILPIVIVYLMIGAFVGAFMAEIRGNDDWFCMMIFWPLLVFALIIIGIFSIPVKLAIWISERVNK